MANSQSTNSKTFQLTIAKIEALPLPDTGRVRYYDSEVKGLCLYVYGTGRKVFYMYGRYNGKVQEVKLGEFPAYTVALARKEVRGKASDIVQGNDDKRTVRAELLLSELFERYIKDRILNGIKTTGDMRENFNRYLGVVDDAPAKKHGVKKVKPTGAVMWANRKLSAITRGDVSSLMASLVDAKTGSGKTTANRTLELLRSVYKFGISEQLYKGANPCDGINKYRLQSRNRFLESDMLEPFFKALEAETNQTVKDYILLSLYTGIRKSNLLSLKWSQVKLTEGTIYLPDTKNGIPQTLPLTESAKAILQLRFEGREAEIAKLYPDTVNSPEAVRASQHVFAGISASGHIVTPKRIWSRILRNAELTDLRLHDLRRSMGSWQAATGASLSIIGASLNHTDFRSTQVYSRLQSDPVRASMNKAELAMRTAGGLIPTADILEFKKIN
jgi:integrase